MTCEKCLHSISCRPSKLNDMYEDNAENCPFFKNRADFVEVKHGKWERNERNIPKMKEFHKRGIALSMNEKSIFYTCSCCGSWGSLSQDYCGKCGAKMDGQTPQKLNHNRLCETETFKVGE